MRFEMEKFVINLEDLRFFSPIGVAEQERKVGNDFEVSVRIEFPAGLFEEERLQTSVSYADVYELVAAEMSCERLLLESVAKRISLRIREKWPFVEMVSAKVRKLSVPITGISGSCSVEYLWKKN